MRIGFDAKWYFTGHPSGRVITRNLLYHFVHNFPEHTFVFFLEKKDRAQAKPFSAKNVEYRYCSFLNNLFTNVFCLPFEARKNNLDLLITQNFASPFIHVKQITIVLDIIYKTDPGYFTFLEHAYFSALKPLLRFTDACVTISHFMKGQMEKHGFLRAGVQGYALHLGVDNRFLQVPLLPADKVTGFRLKHNLPERFVLYVGRINKRKNLPALLEAVRDHTDGEIPIVLCGKADWKTADIDDLINSPGLRSRVIMPGHVPDEDLPMLYRCATVLGYVSFTEGFGLPPLEAMACGTPVVVSNGSSFPEVCGDCVCYVDPASPVSIGEGLMSVLTNPELQISLSEKGKKRAAEFTWLNCATNLIKIAEEVSGNQE